ncbi:MAG TPA: HlyD family efflux transporter periplasmic adaptor subunit [Bryobacteraceae bacterium]|jgi:HlyD family secretion protein|nr:HlyD family efflux transporter periplasmic adaptor subunit [Bryobacteraceae bacterium]
MKVILPSGMTRIAVVLLGLLIAIVISYSMLSRTGASAHTEVASPQPPVLETQHSPAIALASPGRIEARSDVVNVGAAIDGVVRTIHVQEGQVVKRGDILADLACDDLQSGLQVAMANRDSLKETRVRLQRGSRPEEREAATQKTVASRAVLDQAAAQLGRMSKLYEAQEISRLAFEEAQRDRNVAEAQFQQAQRNEELVNAGPLPEELARADADLSAAEAGIKLAQDKLSKCVVRAPIDGAVLRVLLREGESFGLISPRPLFTVADVSGRRVRAEVDENDIANVHVGQKLLVSADAYSHRTFMGVVTQLANVMGRKSVVTGDPAQKADRDILEVTADLNQPANTLPIGLRVTVQFMR